MSHLTSGQGIFPTPPVCIRTFNYMHHKLARVTTNVFTIPLYVMKDTRHRRCVCNPILLQEMHCLVAHTNKVYIHVYPVGILYDFQTRYTPQHLS